MGSEMCIRDRSGSAFRVFRKGVHVPASRCPSSRASSVIRTTKVSLKDAKMCATPNTCSPSRGLGRWGFLSSTTGAAAASVSAYEKRREGGARSAMMVPGSARGCAGRRARGSRTARICPSLSRKSTVDAPCLSACIRCGYSRTNKRDAALRWRRFLFAVLSVRIFCRSDTSDRLAQVVGSFCSRAKL